jgi:hypothetical protein
MTTFTTNGDLLSDLNHSLLTTLAPTAYIQHTVKTVSPSLFILVKMKCVLGRKGAK